MFLRVHHCEQGNVKGPKESAYPHVRVPPETEGTNVPLTDSVLKGRTIFPKDTEVDRHDLCERKLRRSNEFIM